MLTEQWLRDKFDTVTIDGIECIEWEAENGNLTRAPISAVVQMFDGEETTYDAFASRVDSPLDPDTEGVNWGNHVRAWRDQGKFD